MAAAELERDLMRWGSIAAYVGVSVGLGVTVGQTWAPWAGWAVLVVLVGVPFMWTLREIRDDAADRAEARENAPDTWTGPSGLDVAPRPTPSGPTGVAGQPRRPNFSNGGPAFQRGGPDDIT